MEQMNNNVVNLFGKLMDNVEEKTSVFGGSEQSGNLTINMNSHDNQGNIIFIPLLDANGLPFFCSNVAEVEAFWNHEKMVRSK